MNPQDMKRISRGIGCDMSPEAIAHRINIVSRLRALTQQLGKAEKVGKERGVRQSASPTESAGPDREGSIGRGR